jgi:phosphoinositide-3-kinase regulatory subunit 4
VVVGRAATEQFVVPCIESALNDDEEQVVNEALACLSILISTSLLTRTSLLGTEAQPATAHADGRPIREKQGVIKKSATLLLHPVDTVRQNAASFIFFCWRHLGKTDTHAFASRILQPYLQYNPSFETLQHFISCLKAPTTSLGSTNSKAASSAASSSINSEVEFSVKLARTLIVPSQWLNEPTLPSLPLWYESLQRVARENPNLSDPYFSLGIRAFEQVYGINVPVPSTSPNQQMITSWIGDENLLQVAKDASKVTSLLSGPQVRKC